MNGMSSKTLIWAVIAAFTLVLSCENKKNMPIYDPSMFKSGTQVKNPETAQKDQDRVVTDRERTKDSVCRLVRSGSGPACDVHRVG